MKRGHMFWVISVLWVIMTLFICSVSAQNVNVDDMSKEELTTLLMQIIKKMEQNKNADQKISVETGSETLGRSAAPMPDNTTEVPSSAIKSVVYENKKLVVESLPDYYFIRREKTEPEERNESENKEQKYYQYRDFSDGPVIEYPVYTEWSFPGTTVSPGYNEPEYTYGPSSYDFSGLDSSTGYYKP